MLWMHMLMKAYRLGIAQHEQPPETHPSISQRLLHHTTVNWRSEASLGHGQLATARTDLLT